MNMKVQALKYTKKDNTSTSDQGNYAIKDIKVVTKKAKVVVLLRYHLHESSITKEL